MQQLPFESDPAASLLNEEVQDAEVREILERLAARDLGGSELATVGALCEATGATPQLVARLLAEIRQTNLDEKFGAILDDHEAALEDQADAIERQGNAIKRIERRTGHAHMGEELDLPPTREEEVVSDLVRGGFETKFVTFILIAALALIGLCYAVSLFLQNRPS